MPAVSYTYSIVSGDLPIAARVQGNFATLKTVLETGEWPDSQLVSPNNSAYKTLLVGHTAVANSVAAGTYVLSGQNVTLNAGSGTFAPLASGGNIARQSGTTGDLSATPSFLYFDDADFIVDSLSQKLQLRAQVNCNTVSWSSVTATFGLYPVTFAGGNNIVTATLGTVVPGSTVAIANPTAAGNPNQAASGDFTKPSDGQYCLGVVTSAPLTGNAAALLTAQLQTRNV